MVITYNTVTKTVSYFRSLEHLDSVLETEYPYLERVDVGPAAFLLAERRNNIGLAALPGSGVGDDELVTIGIGFVR